MTYIYIDTALLAVPNYGVDAETVGELFDRVIHFAAVALPEVPLTTVIAANVEDILWANNFGPSYDQLRDFIQLVDLGAVYSPGDILHLYHSIIEYSLRADGVPPM